MNVDQNREEMHTAGYLIVRRPRHAEPAVQIDGTYYSGVFRNPWAYFSTNYYDGDDDRAASFYRRIKQATYNRGDATGIDVLRNGGDAREMYQYVQELEGAASQLVVLASQELAKLKGGSLPVHEQVRWLGYDPVRSWSLLKMLMCERIAVPEWRPLVNENGLLRKRSQTRKIVDIYNRAVERLGEGPEGLDPLLDDSRIPTLTIHVGVVDGG